MFSVPASHVSNDAFSFEGILMLPLLRFQLDRVCLQKSHKNCDQRTRAALTEELYLQPVLAQSRVLSGEGSERR